MGRRFLPGSPGVYFHGEATKRLVQSCNSYGPLFGDGTYVAAFFGVCVDIAWQVKTDHQNQKVQRANRDCSSALDSPCPGGLSIYPVALWICHIGYQDLQLDAQCTLVWNPALEIPP